jgi:glycosyltransferase involved in cell wall biosynthesis
MKVLEVAHACSNIQPGGAQQVASNLFSELSKVDNANDYFVMCAIEPQFHWYMDASLQVIQLVEKNHFHLKANTTPYPFHFSFDDSVFHALHNFIQQNKIDVVHFHHFINIGINTIKHLISQNPKVKFGFTFHEYLTICGRDGQMLSSESVNCSDTESSKCQKCLKWKKIDLENRQILMFDFLNSMDFLIAPSLFLIGKIENTFEKLKGRINLIENPVRTEWETNNVKINSDLKKVKFGFFAASTATKGAELVFSALLDLIQDIQIADLFEFHFFGQTSIDSETAEKLKNVAFFHGIYENRDANKLLADLDYLVMSSIWWENSPLVITEAAGANLGMIVPAETAMHEKTQPYSDVFTFKFRNLSSLVAILKRVINLEPWERRNSSNAAIVKNLVLKSLAEHRSTYDGSFRSGTQS